MAEILAIKVSGHAITRDWHEKCRNSLTKQRSKYSAWTVPTVLADFSHNEIACLGKMWIFICRNICILHI